MIIISDVLIVIAKISAVVLLLPLIFWTAPFLWRTSLSYLKFGLYIYVQIFNELGPIFGTMMGVLLISFYIAIPSFAIYGLSTELWKISISGVKFAEGNFSSFRFFWQFSIVCVLVFIVKEYCKLIYRIKFKNS